MEFEKLVHEPEFMEAITNIQSLFDELDGPHYGDLEGAIEFEFLHNETYEQYFIDLNEIDTLKFKLFVANCLLSDSLNQRWYP